LSDLRDSGSIEQDADLVMFLHREEYYYNEQGKVVPRELSDMLEIIISKFRRYIPSQILYHCDITNNRLMQIDEITKNRYVNFLRGSA
jgi:replicative DNA helicase